MAQRKAVMSTAQSRTVRRVRLRSPGSSGSAIAEGSSQRYSVRVISTKLRSPGGPGVPRGEGATKVAGPATFGAVGGTGGRRGGGGAGGRLGP